MDITTANNTVAIVMANPIAEEMSEECGITLSAFNIMQYLFYPYLLLVISLIAIYGFEHKQK